jgi:hypothetical protein
LNWTRKIALRDWEKGPDYNRLCRRYTFDLKEIPATLRPAVNQSAGNALTGADCVHSARLFKPPEKGMTMKKLLTVLVAAAFAASSFAALAQDKKAEKKAKSSSSMEKKDSKKKSDGKKKSEKKS